MVDQDGEPKVGDSVEVQFQRLECQGQVAEVGTAQVIQQRVNNFLDGTYTPFSRFHLYNCMYYSAGQIVYISKHSCAIEPTGFIIAVRDNPLMAAPFSLSPCDGDESWDDDLATPPPLPLTNAFSI